MLDVEKFLPVQVVSTDSDGSDTKIGDFHGGVVLQGNTLVDVISREIIATFTGRSWRIENTHYRYVFIQTKPKE